MKIREKLFLLMSVTIIVLTFVFDSSILSVFGNQFRQEKLESSYDTVKQILLSYSYTADDISRYVYESCRGENTAGYLAGIESNPSVSLSRILKSLISNQEAIVAGVFVSREGELYTMNSGENTQELIACWNEGLFDAGNNVQWVYTDNGKAYLKRSIYRPFPYEEVGCGLFEIDSRYLRAVTGMEHLKIGDLCIFDRYGDFRLVGENDDIGFFKDLIEILRSGRTLEREMTVEGEKYYLITANNTIGKESAIYAVSETELLAPYRSVEIATRKIALAIIAVAAVLSFVLSHLFTKSIRTLKKQINDITAEDGVHSQITVAEKRDEIGELASDFNKLLTRIDHLHEANLKENQAQQNARYEMLEWQYRALQAQVSPHFLCNILSSISMLSAVGNAKGVQSLSVDASKYLRRNLNCSSKKNNTIAEEIIISQEYIRLASAMSAIPIVMEVQCPSALESVLIPCYLLQPLVENCIKHGMPPQSSPEFHIEIVVERIRPDAIRIRVSDNGRGFDESFLSCFSGRPEREEPNEEIFPGEAKFGLEGIVRRLTLQYSNRFEFRLSNRESGGASLEIEIPIA